MVPSLSPSTWYLEGESYEGQITSSVQLFHMHHMSYSTIRLVTSVLQDPDWSFLFLNKYIESPVVKYLLHLVLGFFTFLIHLLSLYILTRKPVSFQ